MEKIKKFFKPAYVVLCIVFLIIIAIPIIALFLYFRKRNKTITVIPKISIKEIKNKEEIDQKTLKEGVKLANEILQKMDLKK